MSFKIIIPYKPEPFDPKDHPFRLIEIDRGSKTPKITTFNDCDDEDTVEDDIEDYSHENYYSDEESDDDYYDEEYVGYSCSDNYDDDDDYSMNSYEEEDNRQQFDTMDIENTDWNTCDINSIIF